MTPTKVHVLAAALLLALALASPAPQDKPLEAAPNQPQHPVHLQKRAASQDSSPEVRAFPLPEPLLWQTLLRGRRSCWQRLLLAAGAEAQAPPVASSAAVGGAASRALSPRSRRRTLARTGVNCLHFCRSRL